MSALILDGLSRHFGGMRAVDGVDLEFASGRTHGVIGPNGAGKTTLFNLISGVIPPSAGRLRYGGEDLTHVPSHERALRGIVRTYQVTSLFSNLTVWENVSLASRSAHRLNGRLSFGGKRQIVDERVGDTLARLGLSSVANRLVGELSHGEQRLVEIGIGLSMDPHFLLLDEPTAGMSRAETHAMVDQLQKLRSALPDMAIVIVEHDMEVVFALVDVLTVMHHGEIVTTGDPGAVRENPDVVNAYLGRSDN